MNFDTGGLVGDGFARSKGRVKHGRFVSAACLQAAYTNKRYALPRFGIVSGKHHDCEGRAVAWKVNAHCSMKNPVFSSIVGRGFHYSDKI
jgi:hypothetical protein